MPELTVATKQNIERVFDDSAPAYDRVGPAIYEPFGTRLVDWLPLKPGATMLDIAAGAGAVLLPAARLLGSEGRIIGIDLSDGLLHQAEVLAGAAGLTNVELRKMDAEHLEFDDQAFDFVTCAFSLYFFPDMEAALRIKEKYGCHLTACPLLRKNWRVSSDDMDGDQSTRTARRSPSSTKVRRISGHSCRYNSR
jgi:ubiquinone/menaquinone biosynthesis C-methylase UbiE